MNISYQGSQIIISYYIPLHRVGDYYTRDRSTPQPDSFYGGEDDLSGAEGWVSDGNTHIMFRDESFNQVFLI